jgi:hypothetical protein
VKAWCKCRRRYCADRRRPKKKPWKLETLKFVLLQKEEFSWTAWLVAAQQPSPWQRLLQGRRGLTAKIDGRFARLHKEGLCVCPKLTGRNTSERLVQ